MLNWIECRKLYLFATLRNSNFVYFRFETFWSHLIMTDQWNDNSISSAQVKDDDDEAPDDWEAELEEKVCSLHLFYSLKYL